LDKNGLIAAGNDENSWLFTSFLTKIKLFLDIFNHLLIRAKVSISIKPAFDSQQWVNSFGFLLEHDAKPD
jgi:hypothetical protein